MYVVLGLVGSSIDGFISGFLIKNLGVKLGKRQWINIFGVISMCCFLAALAGRILSYTHIEKYIDLLGVMLMLCLAFSAFQGIYNDSTIKNKISVNLLAFSLAADASIVCMYLGLSGANIFAIAIASGALHCGFLQFGIKLSGIVTKTATAQLKAKMLAAGVFLFIALLKLISVF